MDRARRSAALTIWTVLTAGLNPRCALGGGGWSQGWEWAWDSLPWEQSGNCAAWDSDCLPVKWDWLSPFPWEEEMHVESQLVGPVILTVAWIRLPLPCEARGETVP